MEDSRLDLEVFSSKLSFSCGKFLQFMVDIIFPPYALVLALRLTEGFMYNSLINYICFKIFLGLVTLDKPI